MEPNLVDNLPKGVEFRLGIPAKGGSRVQSVLFDKSMWGTGEARQWLTQHGFHGRQVEVPKAGKFYHFPQEAPRKFKAIRTMRNPRRREVLPTDDLLRAIEILQTNLEEMADDVREGGLSERAIADALHDVKRALEIIRGER